MIAGSGIENEMVRLASIFGGTSAYDGPTKKITTNAIKVRTDGQGGMEKNYPILSVQFRL